jgi:hypothetical protein
VLPRTVFLLSSSLAVGRGGLKVISLYNGVGTDTMALLHKYSPRAEETNTPSPVW